jgi:hypothetical protein
MLNKNKIKLSILNFILENLALRQIFIHQLELEAKYSV